MFIPAPLCGDVCRAAQLHCQTKPGANVAFFYSDTDSSGAYSFGREYARSWG